MLLRKTAWSWKSGLAVISFVLILSVSGCSDAPPEEDTVSETVIDIQAIPEDSKENAEEIINICIDLYKKAASEEFDVDTGEWQTMLDLDRQGKVKDTLSNIATIIRFDENLQPIVKECNDGGIVGRGYLADCIAGKSGNPHS